MAIISKRIKLIGMLLCALPFLSVSCGISSAFMGRQPHYLLEQEEEGETLNDGTWDYHPLKVNAHWNPVDQSKTYYAVSLSDNTRASVTVPSTCAADGGEVVALWHDCFRDATNLTSVTMGNNIRIIDYEAFIHCKISSINIPYTVELLGESAFYSCENLQTVRFYNSSADTAFSDSACPVEGEEQQESQEGDIITSVLQEIPAFCFFKCAAMSSLLLPSSVRYIRREAFNGCVSLSSMLSFQSIKVIEARAFQGCSSIQKVFIPTSFFDDYATSDIEPLAFNHCSSTLHFYFACENADVAKYNSWMSAHPNWGRYSEYNASLKYASGSNANYERTTGGAYYSENFTYTITNGEATITSYIGDTDVDFVVVPNYLPLGSNTPVVAIMSNALNNVKTRIKRLYLPIHLKSIGESRFEGWTNLKVIAGGAANCSTDLEAGDSATPRVDLKAMIGLENIGKWAFSKLPNVTSILKVTLPYSVKFIGAWAFCQQNWNQRMPNCRTFIWDYDDEKSCLEFIDHEAFYKFGSSQGGANFGDKPFSRKRFSETNTPLYDVSTIVFPRTFIGFTVTPNQASAYNSSTPTEKAAHTFAGCPLIEKIVFKGSDDPNETTDLIINIETFAFNDCLRTVIFEGRKDHIIIFHTETGNWDEPALGYSSGKLRNDLKSQPGIQNIIIDNRDTDIRFQDDALAGNSRASLYFAGDFLEDGSGDDNIYSDNNNNPRNWINQSNRNSSRKAISNSPKWRMIGDEKRSDKMYLGYFFGSTDVTNSDTNYKPAFNISQKIPVYSNIYYSETVEAGDFNPAYTATVGDQSCANRLVFAGNAEKGRFAYVLGEEEINGVSTKVATVSKYQYDRFESSFTGTAVVPKAVTYDNKSYKVTRIGDSAFSGSYATDGIDGHPEFAHLKVPNTIASIGDYAFIRTYGLQDITAYEEETDVVTSGTMPRDLSYIGLYAFLFTNITAFLNIPYDCAFYETSNAIYNIGSCFSNNFALRQITFTNPPEGQSALYGTTTYEHSDGVNYTSCLYSNRTASNPNKLLLVLNRDYADYGKPSSEVSISDNKRVFSLANMSDGIQKNPFLMNAFYMGHWIQTLDFGKMLATTSNGARDTSKLLPQALIAGICYRPNYTSSATTGLIYLSEKADGKNDYYHASTAKCDLECVTSETDYFSKIPKFAFWGCEKFNKIKIPSNIGGITDGIFAEMNATDIIYETPSGEQANILDLTGTTASYIGSDAFYANKKIKKVIFPAGQNITIWNRAFENSTIEQLDFSNVTGTITFKPYSLHDSSIKTITWPLSAEKKSVTIDESAFRDCKSLESFELPNKLNSLGKFAFAGCTKLTEVTVDGVNTTLTKIWDNSFQSDGLLDSFEFDALTAVTEIGNSAFEGTGQLQSGGVVSLPASVTSFAYRSFKNTKATKITINSSSITFVGEEAFADNTALQTIDFSIHDCTWTSGYNKNVFQNCGALTNLCLPTGFSLNNSSGNSMVNGDSSATILSYQLIRNAESLTNFKWRYYTGSNAVPICYYVATALDALNSAGTALVDTETTNFWTKDSSGNYIQLGHSQTYENGVVTFSSGYKLASDGTLTEP
ncbi:MAG: leucine-rich repeat domain-containing protein [Bacilli bacterium]|nr:leucine-rich repeat domain-containing protein [Bacilli bacterium]